MYLKQLNDKVGMPSLEEKSAYLATGCIGHLSDSTHLYPTIAFVSESAVWQRGEGCIDPAIDIAVFMGCDV